MADDSPLPELPWLDRPFVSAILSREEGAAVSVEQMRVAKAVGKGDNYASLLLRVSVDFTVAAAGDTPSPPPPRRSTSLIVKCFPEGEIAQTFIRESGVFDRERRMYFSTLPALHAVLLGAEAEASRRFAPEALPCDRADTIVLRDLRDEGFRMSDRHAGLDLAHASLVLRTLARLHAASVALHARDPREVESYTDIFYCAEKRGVIDKFIPPTLESVAKVVDRWSDPALAGCGEKIRRFAKTAVDKVMEAVHPSETFLNVLNHGDCWVNNSMFKYKDESGDIEEMKFIDFQIVRYGSPALDLQYFLYTSVSPDVRETRWHDLLKEYVEHLNDTLRTLGHGDKAIAVEPLEEDMIARGAFGLVSSCTVLCAVVAEPSEALCFEDLTPEALDAGDTKMFDKAMSGKRFNDALKRLLPHFLRTGVL